MTKKEVIDLSYGIVGCAIEVHKLLGPGLLESVYEKCLIYELRQKRYQVEQQVVIPVVYKNIYLDANIRLDILVNDCIIIELKAVEILLPVHEAQLYSYMQMLSKPQGLLINFNCTNISKTMKPLVNEFYAALDDE